VVGFEAGYCEGVDSEGCRMDAEGAVGLPSDGMCGVVLLVGGQRYCVPSWRAGCVGFSMQYSSMIRGHFLARPIINIMVILAVVHAFLEYFMS
jgi:hypothetical protein